MYIFITKKFVRDCKQYDVWKFITVQEREKQKDGVSCGIFVILFIIRFLKGETYMNLGNIQEFRKSLKQLLRRNSDDISSFCCHCGNIKRDKIKCRKCNYRVCKMCVKDKNKYNKNFSICKICTNNILKL